MNYLVAIDSFFPDRPSGSARVAWDIAQVVRDGGHNVTVFCRKSNSSLEDVSEFEGVKVVRFDVPKTASLDIFKVRKFKNAATESLRKYISDTKWDIVHIHLPLIGDAVLDFLGDGPRYVYTMHSPVVPEQIINWKSQGFAGWIKCLFGKGQLWSLERKIVSRAEAIHTLSHYIKSKIEDFYGMGSKVTVIPHWCREDFFREFSKEQAREQLGWPADAKIFFTLRRLAPRMGIDIAIKAIAPVLKHYDNARFVIAGSGVLEAELKALAESLGVSDRIWFSGRISDYDLKRCYESADMFLLPTLALEGFGLIILEALAYGLPIISSDAGAIREIMEQVLPECIVPAGNVELLRKKLESFADGTLELPKNEWLIVQAKKNYGQEIITSRIKEFLGV